MRKSVSGGAGQEGRVVPATAGCEEWCRAADVFPLRGSTGFVVGAGGQGSICIFQIRHSSETLLP